MKQLSINIGWDEAAEFVKKALMQDYEIVSDDKLSPLDEDLLFALEKVLDYYCSPSEYQQWLANRNKVSE